MRIYTRKHGKISATQAKIQSSLIFAVVFGLIMLLVGLSQLFAQSTVAFILQPYYQSANADEDRSLSVSLINSGQRIDGGSVKIVYNPAQLSYVTFNASINPYVTMSNKVNSAGSYSFDFQVAYGSPDTPSLGAIILKAKPLSTSQAAYITFDTAGTKAYFGANAASRTYYPTSNGQAAIVINAGSPAATQPSNTNQPPPITQQPAAVKNAPKVNPPVPSATTSAPIASNSGPAVNSSLAQAPPAQPFMPEEFIEDGQNYIPPSDPVSKPRRIAPIIFISVGVIFMAFAGGAYIYLKYIRNLPLGMGASRPLNTGLFDNSPEPVSDEGVVIIPSVALADEHESELKTEAKTHPHIITKSKEKAMRRHNAEGSQKKPAPHHDPSEQAVRTPVNHVAVPHKSEPVHHESETITVPIHPHPEPVHNPPKHSDPVPTEEPAKTRPPKPQPVAIPPPLMPVLARSQPAKEIKGPIQDPGHHLPDWQAKLSVPHTVAADDPPDMYELAHDHPESFGSSQLYEVETKEKESHDKSQK